MQACGGGAVAASTTDPDPMVGVWDSTVTVKDCMSGAVLATFRGLGAVHQGGTWTSVNSNPPTSAGPTLGTWKNEGNGSYTTALVFLRFNPDLTPAGYQKAKSTRTLGRRQQLRQCHHAPDAGHGGQRVEPGLRERDGDPSELVARAAAP